MSQQRRLRLWSLIVESAHGRSVTIDDVGAAVLSTGGIDAAAIAVTLPAVPRETMYTSGSLADALEDLTMTIGEGPSAEAIADGPSMIADLDDPQCLARWPVFAPAVIGHGVRAVFALPLRVGAIRLGVMDLYRRERGALEGELLADVLVLTDLACALLLGTVRDDRKGRDGLPERIVLQHPEVHQATGMVTVQLGVSAAVALARLRAYAYATDRTLRDVAGDVVARVLRFDPDEGTDAG
ncbi:ANTAR domain-containing protein [Nucisporomicrobium flavum]|uniref:ANTAR domain-containing protein n=1 Tax=Nucisporomicrobium flavum TaxID=2785915 RepID=UPI0018F29384|nr:ANTAR domain-containing protein [Nucisporomicrobium flavum]